MTECVADVGSEGLDPPRAACVARLFLENPHVAELAPSSLARLCVTQPAPPEALCGLLEMHGHLVAHLAIEGATPKDGSKTGANFLEHREY
jgi:hypothetical protein